MKKNKLALGDRMIISFVRLININPEKKDKVIKKLKLYQKLANLQPLSLKRGFERLKFSPNNVPIEIVKRKNSQSKTIVLVAHGGAFIMGLMNTYRNLYVEFNRKDDDIHVAVVDYRVAPQHKYPLAHDDIMTSFNFLIDELGYKPGNIVLVGDSSGGNLILSLLLKLRDSNRELPKAAVVMSPWIDFSGSGDSYSNNYSSDIIFGRRNIKPSHEGLQKVLKSGIFSYVTDADRNDPYVSPIHGQYHNMPPMLVIAGENEMLLSDALTLTDKIREFAGDVQLLVGKGMFHSYPVFPRIFPSGKRTIREVVNFVKIQTTTKKDAS